MIVVVKPDEAARSWHIFEPMFKTVTDKSRGCFEPIDILKEILAGRQIMWAAVGDPAKGPVYAVMTTEIIQLRKRVCKVLWIAGDHMEMWMPDWIETIEKYGRDQKCDFGEGFMRRGWLRVWPGTEENGVNIIKDLTK